MLFAVVVALLLEFLNWYIAPTKPGDKKDLVLAMAQILAGTALLSGLYFIWRTLQVNREGQITEHFTRAIDQLGATDDKGKARLEIRLGGIYGLERIAKDSPERDYSTIMEVLTAYVRSNAPRSPYEGHKPTSVTLRFLQAASMRLRQFPYLTMDKGVPVGGVGVRRRAPPVSALQGVRT